MVLGIGLGVLTGSALRWFAPQVQRQTLNLPSWLQLPETVEAETPAQNNNKPETNPKPVVGRFQPTREIPELSARWRSIAATQKDLQISAYTVSYTHLTLPTIYSV